MKEIDLFYLKRTESEHAAHAVCFGGKLTNLTLEADKIDHQFEIGGIYLLVTTEPASFSESVTFYLLDSELNELDELSMAGDFYESPFLANLKVTGSRELEFSFYSESERWKLSVLPKRKFVLPNLNPYSGISRSGWLISYFYLKKK